MEGFGTIIAIVVVGLIIAAVIFYRRPGVSTPQAIKDIEDRLRDRFDKPQQPTIIVVPAPAAPPPPAAAPAAVAPAPAPAAVPAPAAAQPTGEIDYAALKDKTPADLAELGYIGGFGQYLHGFDFAKWAAATGKDWSKLDSHGRPIVGYTFEDQARDRAAARAAEEARAAAIAAEAAKPKPPTENYELWVDAFGPLPNAPQWVIDRWMSEHGG